MEETTPRDVVCGGDGGRLRRKRASDGDLVQCMTSQKGGSDCIS